MGGMIGRVLCVHDITTRVIIILIIYIYIKDTTSNGWVLSGFDVVTLWCHNLNDKTKWMADIAQTLVKKGNDLYILLCALKSGVGS